jgi:hypothetical protein
MKNRRSLLALTLTVVLFHPALPAAREDDAPSGPPTIADLAFLAGTWSGNAWGGTFTAYYTTPEGGRVISHSKLMQGGREAFYEFEVFAVEDEEIRMLPFPGGKRATGLALADLVRDERKAVFENPDKDYPTRIVYQRVAEDRLVITLSDPHGGSSKVEVFDLKR